MKRHFNEVKSVDMLSHKNPKLRIKAINSLLVEVPFNSKDFNGILDILGRCTQDSDFRVRITSLKAFFFLHNENISLSCEPFYQHCVSLLSDDFVEVRIEALKFFWLLSNIFSNKLISVNNSRPVVLHDYAFKKICSCVSDISPAVRSTACRLLGSLTNISEDLILQTMSKTVLNDDVERNENDLDKQTSMKEFFGVKLEDQILENFQEGSILKIADSHLINSAAAGAFIHGLEDEFLEVRTAAIDAICELSQYSENLSVISTSPLVDMFNDEIHGVRDNAINSLRKMGKRVIFKEEEFGIVLATSEDKEVSTRVAIYKLLKSTKLPNTNSLKKAIDTLLQNLRKYPEDIDSIFSCLMSLGEQYCDFCEKIVYDLLQIDKRFLPREANVNDHDYIGKMIVILNATVKNRKIPNMLPAFAKLHYQYMRDRWPAYTPRLDHYVIKIQDFPVSFNFDKNLTKVSFGEMRLLGTIEHFLQFGKRVEATKLLKQCKTCFLRIFKLDKSLAVKSEYYLQYLRCLKLVMKINPTITSQSCLTSASKLIQLTYEIQNRYLGLSIESLLHFHLLRIYSHAIVLACQQRLISLFGISHFSESGYLEGVELQDTIKSFKSRVEMVEKKYEEFGLVVPEAIGYWKNFDYSTPDIDKFSNDILEYKIGPIKENEEERVIKKIYADMILPKSNVDNAVIFLQYFPIQIDVEGIVYSTLNTKKIMVRILFPDNSAQFFFIPPSKIKPTKPLTFHIKTTIVVHQNIWTEKSEFHISFVVLIDSEIPWFDNCLAKINSKNTRQEFVENVEWIEISQPVRYYISPKDGILFDRTT